MLQRVGASDVHDSRWETETGRRRKETSWLHDLGKWTDGQTDMKLRQNLYA